MSDTDEVAQAIQDGNDTATSDADQAPIIDYGKEITKQDLSGVQHDDISNKTDVTESPEGQIRIQVSSGQDEVKDHTDQNPDNSRQDEDECCINKVQPGANTIENNIIKVAGHQAHVQESSGTGEVQSQINCTEKDAAQSETGKIQIHAIDDVQDEAQSKVGQVDEQTSSGEQEGFQCDVSQVDEQTTNNEQEGFQCDVSQIDDQTTSGEQEGFQCDVGQIDEQTTSDEQEGFQCDVSQVDEQITSGEQEGFQCDVSQVDDQTSTGHDEAQSEVDNPPTSNELEAAQDEFGQNQTNSDENIEAMNAASQVKLPTNGGRAVAAKTAVGKVKPKPTGRRIGKLTGKSGVLTGKKFPTSMGKKKRLATKITRKIVKASSDLLQAKTASGQAQTKCVLSQTKNVEKEELNVVAADEVQPELTDEKEPMNVENNASDTKETENEMADVLSKDQVQADTDLTWPSVSTQSPASGGLPESDGSHASKESKSVTMFWCDICKVVCTSAMNLQMHFLGFKHKKIEAALKWNVNTEDEGTKDEFLAPSETRTVEDHLSKMKLNKAVLGLDYVVEYHNDQNTNPQLVCKLCYCKSELTWFLPHLLGAKHMANYLEKHHPYILKYEGEKLKPSEWKEFVFRKALEIEKTDGRGKVKVVLEKIDTKPNEKTAVKRVAGKPAAEPERKVQKTEAAPSTAAAEPEHTVQNTEAAPSTAAAEPEHTVQNTEAAPSTAGDTAQSNEQSEPSTAQDMKENENWTGMYLYPDGLPITLPKEAKPQPQPVLAHQEAAAVATSAIDDLLSPIGSKFLENYIIQTDFDETIIGLDFLTEYRYVGKPEPLYYCELCTCELPIGCVLAHIFGLKHKMRYVKKRHPELLRLNAAKYKTIVKKKAAEIEETDGRGRVRVIRNFEGPALSERIAAAKIAAEEENKLQEMQEYSSYDQDQSTNMETYQSPDTRTKRSSASTSSKPSGRTSSSKGGSRSDSRYSRRDYSTSKRDQPRKRESSKDIKRSGKEWRDEWERSIKRAKSLKQDRKEKERVKERSTRSDRDKDRRKSRSDSKDDYKRKEKPRSSKEDRSKGSDTSVQAPAKPSPAKREAIIKKEILKYLTSFKVINDTDAGYVKDVMYELSNRLLQFGQKAMKITGSAEKLIEETKSCIPDGNPRRELHVAPSLASYPGNSGRDACMRQSVEYPSSGTPFRSSSNNPTSHPVMRNTDVTMSSIHSNILTPSLLNSIRGMDENTITRTLSRLAANNPAFEGIRISTLVTVLREAGVLSKKPN